MGTLHETKLEGSVQNNSIMMRNCMLYDEKEMREICNIHITIYQPYSYSFYKDNLRTLFRKSVSTSRRRTLVGKTYRVEKLDRANPS